MKHYFLAAALMVAASPAVAGPMTCADYADKVKAYSYCSNNNPANSPSRGNCCAGAADLKAVCDIFHVIANSHSATAELLNLHQAARRIADKDLAECIRWHH